MRLIDFAFRLLEQKELSFNLLNKTSEKRDGSIFSDFMDDNVDIKDISACISLPTEDFWVVVESAVLSRALPIAREETFLSFWPYNPKNKETPIIETIIKNLVVFFIFYLSQYVSIFKV